LFIGYDEQISKMVTGNEFFLLFYVTRTLLYASDITNEPKTG